MNDELIWKEIRNDQGDIVHVAKSGDTDYLISHCDRPMPGFQVISKTGCGMIIRLGWVPTLEIGKAHVNVIRDHLRKVF